ncbi:hypothetical protein niasHT_032049 [Heterodera trifolii]|uniref:Glycine-rich protein n=1 Tax=Heterodera trifolii TaxID=157864 RepID=A0ABD2I991_9BILA
MNVTVLLLLFVIAFLALTISAPIEETNSSNGKLKQSDIIKSESTLMRQKRYGYGYGGYRHYGYANSYGQGYGYRRYGGYGYGYGHRYGGYSHGYGHSYGYYGK